MDIFRQRLDSLDAEPLVTGPERDFDPALSQDGTALLYWTCCADGSDASGASVPRRLMRIPVAGGAPVQVLDAVGSASVQCARAPAEKCVLAEAGEKETVLSAFDPAAGRGDVLLKAPNSAWVDSRWALSPDGRRIALRDPLLLGNRIGIFDLAGGPPRELTVTEMRFSNSLSWAIDGHGLFATGWTPDLSNFLVHIDLQGRRRVS